MRYIFLSDLHLGSPLFKSKNKVMELLNNKYDKVFILGDLIDLWEDDIENILYDNRDIITLLNQQNVVIVKGNHDPDINTLKKIFTNVEVVYSFELDMEGNKYLLIHGDECDDLLKKYFLLIKLIYPIQWIGERLFNLNLRGWLRTFLHSVSAKKQNKKYNDLVTDIEKTLVKKYEDSYDYLLLGHTHLPKLVKHDKLSYINCGDWIHSRSYVVYDNGVFTLEGYVND